MELDPRIESTEKKLDALTTTLKLFEERIVGVERAWFRTATVGAACGIALSVVFAIGAQSIPKAALKAGEDAGSVAGKHAAEKAAESEVASQMGPKVKAELELNRQRAREAADSAEQDHKKVVQILDRIGELPVGTIVSLHLPGDDTEVYKHLTRRWVLCDGKLLNADHPQRFKQEDVADEFWNRAVPNLEGRFLRGIDNKNTVGSQGGQDLVRGLRTSNDGAHSHSLPPLTGLIANSGPAPNHAPYHVEDDNDGWKQSNHLTTEGKPGREGQHRHLLGGNTGDSVAHSHLLADIPTIPKYESVRFAIRIK